MSEEPVTHPPGDLERSAPPPLPVQAPQRRPTRHAPGAFQRREPWRQALDLALDLVDLAADRVAEATGVRARRR